MNWWNKFWIVLFVVGFAYFCYGCYDGAGLTGLLTRWQIETRGTLSVGLWGPFSFVVLVFLPLCFVVKTSKKQPVQLGDASLLPLGVFTGLVAGLGLLSGVAYLQAQQALKEPMVQLRGVGQDALKVSYVSAWATGRGLSSTAGAEIRSCIPVTEPNWKQGAPVRFVFSLRTTSFPVGPLPIGVMQQNVLPWYL